MRYFLKVYKSKVANAKFSLLTPVSIQTLLGNIKIESSSISCKPLQGYDDLYFWDLGINATKKIRKHDTLFIKSGNDLFRGEIEIILEDEAGGIGDAIGWAKQFKAPWKNPIGFLNMVRIIIDKNLENKIEDAINTGSKEAKNFYEIFLDLNEKDSKNTQYKNQVIKKEENYILEHNTPIEKDNAEFGSHVAQKAVNNNLARKPDEDLDNLIHQIRMLKIANHHSEREHESLVERFFLYLGYEYPKDIRYRVGHIDVLINSDTNNSIVVEVKRNWDLSRKNKDVVDQAYGYATNFGSRFVVITNGDYYAFFDRLRGLSIDDNFDFEIKLSQFSDNDYQLLKKYKKSSLL